MGRRCAALMKAGVPASFIPIRGAGHGFEGADAERAFAALIQWFEQHLGVQPVADAAAAARDGDAELRTAEELRAQQRQARIAELRQRFVDGPVFVMACGGSGTSNSLGAVVIPDAGTVYFNPYRLSGRCGTLAAENGVLVAPDGGSRRLPAPVRRRCDDLRRRVDVQGGAGMGYSRRSTAGRLRSCPAAAVTSTITFALSPARDTTGSPFQRIGALTICAK